MTPEPEARSRLPIGRPPRAGRRGRRWLALLALATAAGLARGQEPPPDDDPGLVLGSESLSLPSTEPGRPGELTGIEAAEVDVLKRWFERLRKLEENDAAGAAMAVREMEAQMDKLGIRGMEVLAGAFAHEGYDHLEAGDYSRARESFEQAIRFDPTLPSAYFGLADARRLAGEGVVGYFHEWIRGMRAAARNFWWSYIKLSNVLFLLLISVAAFGCLFALLMTARHQAKWRHDVEEALRERGLSEPIARLFSLALFFVPLLLWLSGVWVLLYWTAGTFRYQSRTEKWLSAILVAFAVIAGPSLSFMLSVYRVTDSDTVKATVSALRGGYEPEKVKYIREILEDRPDDPTFHFLMASILKDGGYFLEAYENYKEVIDLSPQNYRAHNNIGNIYFAMGQHGQAVNWYRKATDLNPKFAIGFFNMSLAQKEQLHFTEAEESLEKARTLDADAIAAYLERTGTEAAASPVDAKLPWSEAWFEVVRGRRGAVAAPGAAGRIGLLNPITVGSVLTLGTMIVLLLAGRRKRLARRCPRCGRAFCARCMGEASTIELCAGCTNLFLKKGDLEPEVRQQKQDQVARYEFRSRLVPRLAALLLPGSAQLLTGRAAWGALLGFGWLLLWVRFLVGPRLLSFTASPYVAEGTLGLWMTVAVMALVWLLGNLVGMRGPRPGAAP